MTFCSSDYEEQNSSTSFLSLVQLVIFSIQEAWTISTLLGDPKTVSSFLHQVTSSWLHIFFWPHLISRQSGYRRLWDIVCSIENFINHWIYCQLLDTGSQAYGKVPFLTLFMCTKNFLLYLPRFPIFQQSIWIRWQEKVWISRCVVLSGLLLSS